ncbi:HD domain-containing phosphohydrolase [uncultured Xylophilus sp.]|uniref:HD-GYP domain-containing protein n=1 Tax=uncultured Xylophilus sp. TaxID=296832 RepID=UPI0025FB17D3|nr:HD domain-containing phosphohydrolase [uncultured Xylophilus sp.]
MHSSPDLPDIPDDTHYRRAFGAMCDRSVVSAQAAIYAENGNKLLEAGARIDSALYARLVRHRLSHPIDQQIGIEGMVTLQDLEARARALAERSALVRRMVQALGSTDPLVVPLRTVPLPGAFALRLTLMRDRYPQLLDLSLKTTMVALYLGRRAGNGERQIAALAAAGLLHDLGMLHMDPAWLAPHRTMSAAERRHLRAHPITGMLLLREQGGYTPEAVAAVFEHHERLDGSGYPRGLRGGAISPLGQTLMLAELAAALSAKFGEAAIYRLGLVLRLNQRGLPAAATGEILALLRDATPVGAAPEAHAAPQQHFEQLAAAFDRWSELQPPAGGGASAAATATPAHAWLSARLAGLRRVLTEAGGDPDEPAYLLAQADDEDPHHRADADAVGREALWQLGAISREALQRWPALAAGETAEASDMPSPSLPPGDAAVAAWCGWVLGALPVGPAVLPSSPTGADT